MTKALVISVGKAAARHTGAEATRAQMCGTMLWLAYDRPLRPGGMTGLKPHHIFSGVQADHGRRVLVLRIRNPKNKRFIGRARLAMFPACGLEEVAHARCRRKCPSARGGANGRGAPPRRSGADRRPRKIGLGARVAAHGRGKIPLRASHKRATAAVSKSLARAPATPHHYWQGTRGCRAPIVTPAAARDNIRAAHTAVARPPGPPPPPGRVFGTRRDSAEALRALDGLTVPL